MIQKVEMYQAVCDRCGEESMKLYRSVCHAQKALTDDGWLIINGLTYCPDCVEYDEETDSYKPKGKDD